MRFSFCSFASGSSGNSYMVRTDNTVVIIDTGIAGKKIVEGLNENNIDIDDVDGILITHEHIDHVKSIRKVSKLAKNANVYASAGTIAQMKDSFPADRTVLIDCDDNGFDIGEIHIEPFELSHDSEEPIGYSLRVEDRRMTIITDTGTVTNRQKELIEDSDLLVLEANHEKNILLMGEYPYQLKQRILSNYGHLSNEASAEAITSMLKNRKKASVPFILLAHLSAETNSPGQAFLTIKNKLFDEDLFENDAYFMEVLPRKEISSVYEI